MTAALPLARKVAAVAYAGISVSFAKLGCQDHRQTLFKLFAGGSVSESHIAFSRLSEAL